MATFNNVVGLRSFVLEGDPALRLAVAMVVAVRAGRDKATFVLPPEDPKNTARVRIFSMGYEMPFAGHPTVGTAIAIDRARNLGGELRLELNTGVFPVRVELDRAVPYAEFANPNLPAERGVAADAVLIEEALWLPRGSIDRGAHRPRKVGAGANYHFVKAPLDAVRRARFNSAAFEAVDFTNTVGVLLYAEGGEAADATYHVRMFAPGAGIPEDPATGGAEQEELQEVQGPRAARDPNAGARPGRALAQLQGSQPRLLDGRRARGA